VKFTDSSQGETLYATTTVRAEEDCALRVRGCSLIVAFLAGFGTPFTVNVVGEMPVGEIFLFGVAAYGLLYIAIERRRPGRLSSSSPFRLLLFCQGIAFTGYILADLVRESSTHDLMRGWARMIFLAIDIFAVAFLFGISQSNILALAGFGIAIGTCVKTFLFGALFDDIWKFGYGGPLTVLVLIISPYFSLALLPIAIGGIGVLHLALGFRSLGAECLILAVLLVVMRFPPRARLWLLPGFMMIALCGAAFSYLRHQGDGEANRSTRSNVERSAMMAAAWEAFTQSPIIGQGSWFSKSQVMNRFVDLRTEYAQDAEVGGFTTDDAEEGITLHSQILVGLAEGGVLGGCFFVLYGLCLMWTIYFCVFQRPLDPLSGLYLLVLIAAVTALIFSPFSGAHRENIAVATGIFLICWHESKRLSNPGVNATSTAMFYHTGLERCCALGGMNRSLHYTHTGS
jgi:O-Antigen ligase